jgi:ubiquinone/menaquinone biosynthesis C-methylase UbiE
MTTSETEWTEEMSRGYARYMERNVKHDHRPCAKRIAADWPGAPPGATVVDVAGGPAFLLLELAPLLKQPRLVLTDISPLMLEIARERAAQRGVEVQTVLCPGERLELADGSVDLLVCKQFLRLAADQGAVLREAARVLRPGGRAYVIDFNAKGPLWGQLLLNAWIQLTAPRFIRGMFWGTMSCGLAASEVPAAMRVAGFSEASLLRSGVSYLARGVR